MEAVFSLPKEKNYLRCKGAKLQPVIKKALNRSALSTELLERRRFLCHQEWM